MPDVAEPDVPDVPDTVADVNPDATGDTKPDTTSDVAPDAKPDVAKDAEPDSAKDAPPDVKADATDTGPDMAGPDTCGGGQDIASLLTCSEGAVDFTLAKVLVTYAFPAGFLVHDNSTTRGMMVYLGTATWPFAKPAVGDVITLHVTKYATFNGQQEFMAADALSVTGKGNASATAVDLATVAKAAFGESLESRLLVGKGLVVKALSGTDGVLSRPGAGDVVFRSDGVTNLCAGAVFDIKTAALTQFAGVYRVHAMNGQSDLGAVDTSKCGGPAVYDESNWGFEEPDATDPPPDFFKLGGAMSAVRTTDFKQQGAASVRLTWQAIDNQDLIAGKYVQVMAGQKTTLTVWLLDEDAGGKARLGLTFYKADKTVVSNHTSGYAIDGPAWAAHTLAFTVPVDAVFVRGFVRLYDELGKWTGKSTVYADTWSLTVQ